MATLAAVQPSPGSWQAWWLAARPATLSASVVPVAVGTAVALGEARARALPALAALCAALLLQIGANFANDVFDFERGADTDRRLGPLRATQGGLLSPAAMRTGMLAAFGVASLLGGYLVAVGGWPIALLGLLALAAAYAYTGGPVPLGYLGLGDPLVFLFFGVFAVTGTYYVQAGGVSGLALAASIPVACLATAILAVNNLRDLETDREAGKRTLAVRVGPEATRRYISALLWTPYLVCGALALVGAAGVGVLLPWLCAPLASRLEHSVARAQGAELNPCLARTARLELLFGALLALGLLA